jgi:hypothetical protein
MQGFVSGVNFSNFEVAPYIQIEGLGWYTKPTTITPTVPINSDGPFSAYVTTGGLDDWATIFCASLVPTNDTPPEAYGNGSVPEDTNSVAMTFLERYGETLSFANRTWAVKYAPQPVGPGSSDFSEDEADVWVDTALHLTIQLDSSPFSSTNTWQSTEVILLDHLGYGTYVIKTTSHNDLLDQNAVFGMFTYDDYGDDQSIPAWPFRELDFEDSFFGDPSGPNTQDVVQPYTVPGNRNQYYLPNLSTNSTLTRVFIWQPGSVRFIALLGDQSPTNYPSGSVINDWTYISDPALDHLIPPPGREHFHLNLWQFNSDPPASGQPVEVSISDFSFIPLPPMITAVAKNGNDLLLSTTGANGTNFVIQATTNLSAGSWETLPGYFVGTGGILPITVTNAIDAPQKFFRIEQMP